LGRLGPGFEIDILRATPAPTSSPRVLQRARGRDVRDRSEKMKVACVDHEAALEQFREIASGLGSRGAAEDAAGRS
jgi:hypothetical protein